MKYEASSFFMADNYVSLSSFTQYAIPKIKTYGTKDVLKRGSGCYAVDSSCTVALTSFSQIVSYTTFLFSEWRIGYI